MADSPRTLTRLAPAKINLTLDVGLRRADGYHDIRSVMQTIALHDRLVVTHTPDTPGVRLDVQGPTAGGVPADPSNIVHQAAVRLQKTAAARGTLSGDRSGLHIALHKEIPSQAGLGGGSSDAAATLMAVSTLFGLALPQRRLTELAASLGADVPFFLTGGTALAEGLGERITALPSLSPPWPLVVVKPPVGVSTAKAYAALDAIADRTMGGATARWVADPDHAPLGNDFGAVILETVPEVAAAHRVLSRDSPDFPPLLCGSGAALFCRTRDAARAEQLAASVRQANVGDVWVTRTASESEGE